MKVTLLYRGVGWTIHEKRNGLSPRGSTSMPVEQWAGPGKWGDDGTWGPSEINGVIEHQRDQKSYPDSAFISTTSSFAKARNYALYSESDGVAYVIEVARLATNGVRSHRVNTVVRLDVTVPDDDEHALIVDPPGRLPEAVVIDTIILRR